jgi:hypothetical protein
VSEILAGSAAVLIKPVFRGFGSAMNANAKSSGAKAGAIAGKKLGASAATAAKKSLSGLAAALGKARDAESAAAGRVRIAELRLQEVRRKSTATASQVAAAEESLAQAQRQHKSALERSTSAQEKYSTAQSRSKALTEASDVKTGRFRATLSKTGSTVGGYAKRLGGLVKTYGALAGGAAIAGATAFLKSTIQPASDAQQSMGATETVFKSAAKNIIAYSEGAAVKYGMSANGYRESANLLGSLFKNQGVPLDQLAKKTDRMVSLGADLSAVYGGTAKDAVDSLSSAFKGEFDSLEKYGISLKQSTVNTEAMRVAGVKTAKQWNALSVSQQQAATQTATTNLIFRDAKDAVGAFGKESGTFAHQQQVAGAAIEDLKGKVGEALLPYLTKGADVIANQVVPAVSKFVDEFKSGTGAGGQFRDRLAEIWDKVKAGISWLQENKKLVLGVVAGFLALKGTLSVVGGVSRAVLGVRDSLKAAKEAAGAFKSGLDAGAKLASGGRFKSIGAVFKAAGSNALSAAKSAGRGALEMGRLAAGYARAGAAATLNAAKTLAVKTANLAVAAATKGWAIAQRLLNVAMRANPIGLVITGLMLLGAGLVLAYKKSATFRRIVQAAWAGIKTAASAVVNWFQTKAWPVISSVFSWISSKASWLWNKGISPAFTGIKLGISAIVTGFTRAKDSIGKVWDGLLGAVAGPIRSALAWISDHFIAPINKILAKFKLPQLPTVSAGSTGSGTSRGRSTRGGQQRYADGGKVRGWSPHKRADNILARLTAGEFVQPVDTVRYYGQAAMEAVRRRKARIVPAYADGGLVGTLKNLFPGLPGLPSLSSLTGSMWAQILGGALGGVLKAVVGKITGAVSGLLGGGSGPLPAGSAGRVFGWANQWDWARRAMPGVILTSGFRTGTLGGKSSLASYHNQGRAIDLVGGPGLAGIFNTIRAAFGSAITELIYSPMNGAQVKNGKPHMYQGKTRAIHFDHVHWAMADGGPVLYDTGGLLMPGLTLARNDTGRPESILADGGAAARGAGGQPLTVQLLLDGRVLTQVVLDRAGQAMQQGLTSAGVS